MSNIYNSLKDGQDFRNKYMNKYDINNRHISHDLDTIKEAMSIEEYSLAKNTYG